MDTVILTNEVTGKMKDEINTPPPNGIYVYGLFLGKLNFIYLIKAFKFIFILLSKKREQRGAKFMRD